MNEFEEFHIALYHAKLEYIGIKSGNQSPPWDTKTQRNIDAFYGFCDPSFEIEAHVMAAKSYFQDKLDYPKIVEVVRECLKNQASKNDFTFVFFNRLNILK